MGKLSSDNQAWSIRTKRLTIRPALTTKTDIEFLYSLWTNPEVMKFVGFPKGDITTNPNKIKEYLGQATDRCFDRVLLANLPDGTIVGEGKLCPPNEDNLAHTDIKLDPKHWGNRYGVEIKQGLLEDLFTHTKCVGVLATPNRENLASIKMQEAVGGRRVKEGRHQFPESMRPYTCDVHYYEYIVDRTTWLARTGN